MPTFLQEDYPSLDLIGSAPHLQTPAPCWGRPQDGQEDAHQEAAQRSERMTHHVSEKQRDQQSYTLRNTSELGGGVTE